MGSFLTLKAKATATAQERGGAERHDECNGDFRQRRAGRPSLLSLASWSATRKLAATFRYHGSGKTFTVIRLWCARLAHPKNFEPIC
jgi:hypothetical protein